MAFFFYQDGWGGLITSLLGLFLGISLLIVPWIMGGMGAGDVKALGSLGALLGPFQLIHVFIYIGLIGGIMAIFHFISERKLLSKAAEWKVALTSLVLTKDPATILPEKIEVSRFPYAAAIALGYYAYLKFGELI